VELRDNYLISSDANHFFGADFNYSGDIILKTVLRYIAIRRSEGDLKNLNPIKVYRNSFSASYDIAKFFEAYSQKGNNIILLTGSDLPEKGTLPEGWIELPEGKYPVCKYLSEVSPTTILVNEQYKEVFVFALKQTDAWTKKFTSSLFRILLWLYPADKLDDDDKTLFKAVDKNDAEALLGLIDKFREITDFRKERLRQELYGWGAGLYKVRVSDLTNTVERLRSNLKTHRDNVHNTLNELAAQTMQLTALKNAPAITDESLFEFFDQHKQLSIQSVQKDNRGCSLYYMINETIEYFDQDEFNEYYENPDSYFYNDDYTDELYTLLLGLFGKEKGRLKARCVFMLTNFTSLAPQRNWSYEDGRRLLPHPHLDSHGCLGGNETPILEYLANGEWEQAIGQTIAAAKNINFGDSTVVNHMMSWLQKNLSTTEKLIVADNDIEMTIQEFLAYLKEDETNG